MSTTKSAFGSLKRRIKETKEERKKFLHGTH
jgi:hypothetical protein